MHAHHISQFCQTLSCACTLIAKLKNELVLRNVYSYMMYSKQHAYTVLFLLYRILSTGHARGPRSNRIPWPPGTTRLSRGSRDGWRKGRTGNAPKFSVDENTQNCLISPMITCPLDCMIQFPGDERDCNRGTEPSSQHFHVVVKIILVSREDNWLGNSKNTYVQTVRSIRRQQYLKEITIEYSVVCALHPV